MGIRILSNLVCVTLSAVAFGAGAQTGGYEVVDLGLLPGGVSSNAHGINASGQVTGESTDRAGFPTGFVWSEPTGMVRLTVPDIQGYESWGINDSGTITGTSGDSSLRLHAYVLQNGVLTDILPTGQRSSGWTLNNATDVVGWRDVDGVSAMAFLRLGNGQLILGPLGSELFDITDADETHGVRASGCWPDPDRGSALVSVYDVDTSTVLITTIPGAARGINQAGTIVGFSENLPFVSTVANDYETPTFVQPLPGYTLGRFFEINDYGVAVGMNSTSPDSLIAVIYGRGVMSDINSLLDPVSGAGWTITNLRDINNDGWMAGAGTKNGVERGVLLRPTDEDGDGLSYHDERFIYGTDPSLPDTDGDGLNDDTELDLETNPLLADTDGDGGNAASAIASASLPSASIAVLYPNGGESLARGTTVEIAWSSTGTIGANVKIVAHKGTASSTLAGGTPNDGSYNWKIPATYPLGSGVTIEISSVATPSIVDTSNAAFTIVNPTTDNAFAVTAPSGGESYFPGQTVPVSWVSAGTSASKVQIVARSAGQTYVVANATENDGTFAWTMPRTQTPGYDYAIEVIPVGPSPITVISPNGGETLVRGTTIPIVWTSTSEIGDSVKIVACKGTYRSVLASLTPNDGSYNWKIPATYPLGPGVTIEISSVSNPALLDASDGPFTIGS